MSFVLKLFRDIFFQKSKSVSCSTRKAFSQTIPRQNVKDLQKNDLQSDSEDENENNNNNISIALLNKKIRMLQPLNTEEIKFIGTLTRNEILSLFMEYNCALRFLDIYKNNKNNKK